MIFCAFIFLMVLNNGLPVNGEAVEMTVDEKVVAAAHLAVEFVKMEVTDPVTQWGVDDEHRWSWADC
jgi:hypothetical protein